MSFREEILEVIVRVEEEAAEEGVETVDRDTMWERVRETLLQDMEFEFDDIYWDRRS